MPQDAILTKSAAHKVTAKRIAQVFYAKPSVQEVFLFGGTAREEIGNDFDLIITADQKIAGQFAWEIFRISDIGELPSSRDEQRTRLHLAEYYLGFAHHELSRNLQEINLLETYHLLDIFIFPPDWQENLAELQGSFPFRDPLFMKNIAQDAIFLTR